MCVPSGPCVVMFMGVLVTPDVNKVVLCDDSVKDFNSALSGLRISAKFIELWVRDGVEIAPDYVVVSGGEERLEA